MKILGDQHNFGRSVRVSSDLKKVLKPRTLLWEHMLLDDRSRIRRILDEIGVTINFARLSIDCSEDFVKDGEVSYLKISCDDELPIPEIEQFGEALGRLIAVSLWFGIADLHFENLALGGNGFSLIVSPLDIECIFEKMILPSQSLIIPASSRKMPYFGLRDCEALKIHRPAMIGPILFGYFSSLYLLSKNRLAISDHMRSFLRDREGITRVVIRPTSHYSEALRNQIYRGSSNFFNEEIEQLERGDIPYFFRVLGDDRIYYFINPDLDRAVFEGHSLPKDQYYISREEVISGPPHELVSNWINLGSLQIAVFLAEDCDLIQGINYKSLNLSLTSSSILSLRIGRFEALCKKQI